MVNRALRAALFAALAACGGPSTPRGPAELVRSGSEQHDVQARGAFSGLKVRFSGPRACALEVSIDAIEASTRRLACRAGGSEAWAFYAAADELFSDFAVHPSGEITLGVERTSVERGAYELVRLDAAGAVRARQVLDPAKIPASDLVDLPGQPLLMRSTIPHALTDGWLRVEPRGEDVAVAWLSRLEAPGGGFSNDLATGAGAWLWTGSAFEEHWSRLVEGRHAAQPAAWTYDEFRWREAAVRPLLAVSDDGTLVVGRAWNQRRCQAVALTFGEFTPVQCRGIDVPSAIESEYLPLAFTSFGASGAREGTRVFVPEGAAEFVAFDLAARGDALALAGVVVFPGPDGVVPLYPADPGGGAVMVPYDGYVAVLDRRSGTPRCARALDASGRGDHIAALRWAADGTLMIAGGAGWDRWYGGMSISRGADPWLAALSPACELLGSRIVPFSSTARHHHLLSVDAEAGRVVSAGLADAPMTHSGDGGHIDQRMFGNLVIALR
jgi:hypothetical protein